MSTRATIWIRSDKDGESVFLFHHCDGYCLDEDIDPILKNMHDDAWNVVDIHDAIQALEFGDRYKKVDTVGWDSEYVYKISIDERKMYKYDTGIGDPYADEANFESRLTNLERTYEYQPEKWEYEPKNWPADKDNLTQEQKPIAESKRLANDVIEYLTKCGYSPVLKDDSKKEHFHIDIPRHEDDFWLSEEYKHCRSVLGEYYMEGDYGGDTYTLYVWREFHL